MIKGKGPGQLFLPSIHIVWPHVGNNRKKGQAG